FGSTLTGTTRNASITAGGGDVSFTGAVTLATLTVNSAHDVSFTTTLTTTGAVSQVAGTGTTTFRGGSVGGALGVVTDGVAIASATLTVTGDVTLTAQNAVSLTANLDATASHVTIAANQDGSGAQSFNQSAGTIVTTNTDPVAVSV